MGKEKNNTYFPLRRDGREDAQCFPMESCRSFVSFPCFKHLFPWSCGLERSSQLCPDIDSIVGQALGHIPSTAQLPVCSHPLPLPTMGSFISLDEQFQREARGLEGVSSEITWCWNKLQASARGVQVTLKGEGCKRRNKLVSLLILCCG